MASEWLNMNRNWNCCGETENFLSRSEKMGVELMGDRGPTTSVRQFWDGEVIWIGDIRSVDFLGGVLGEFWRWFGLKWEIVFVFEWFLLIPEISRIPGIQDKSLKEFKSPQHQKFQEQTEARGQSFAMNHSIILPSQITSPPNLGWSSLWKLAPRKVCVNKTREKIEEIHW
jgi:hypothetical protein